MIKEKNVHIFSFNADLFFSRWSMPVSSRVVPMMNKLAGSVPEETGSYDGVVTAKLYSYIVIFMYIAPID